MHRLQGQIDALYRIEHPQTSETTEEAPAEDASPNGEEDNHEADETSPLDVVETTVDDHIIPATNDVPPARIFMTYEQRHNFLTLQYRLGTYGNAIHPNNLNLRRLEDQIGQHIATGEIEAVRATLDFLKEKGFAQPNLTQPVNVDALPPIPVINSDTTVNPPTNHENAELNIIYGRNIIGVDRRNQMYTTAIDNLQNWIDELPGDANLNRELANLEDEISDRLDEDENMELLYRYQAILDTIAQQAVLASSFGYVPAGVKLESSIKTTNPSINKTPPKDDTTVDSPIVTRDDALTVEGEDDNLLPGANRHNRNYIDMHEALEEAINERRIRPDSPDDFSFTLHRDFNRHLSRGEINEAQAISDIARTYGLKIIPSQAPLIPGVEGRVHHDDARDEANNDNLAQLLPGADRNHHLYEETLNDMMTYTVTSENVDKLKAMAAREIAISEHPEEIDDELRIHAAQAILDYIEDAKKAGSKGKGSSVFDTLKRSRDDSERPISTTPSSNDELNPSDDDDTLYDQVRVNMGLALGQTPNREHFRKFEQLMRNPLFQGQEYDSLKRDANKWKKKLFGDTNEDGNDNRQAPDRRVTTDDIIDPQDDMSPANAPDIHPIIERLRRDLHVPDGLPLTRTEIDKAEKYFRTPRFTNENPDAQDKITDIKAYRNWLNNGNAEDTDTKAPNVEPIIPDDPFNGEYRVIDGRTFIVTLENGRVIGHRNGRDYHGGNEIERQRVAREVSLKRFGNERPAELKDFQWWFTTRAASKFLGTDRVDAAIDVLQGAYDELHPLEAQLFQQLDYLGRSLDRALERTKAIKKNAP